jgi:hypothetical protein
VAARLGVERTIPTRLSASARTLETELSS